MAKSAGFENNKSSSDTGVELQVCIDAQATGITIRKGLASQALAIDFSHSLEFKFYAQAGGNTRITRESPFLDGVDVKHLDKNGIVLPGTIITPNLIAVSAISPLYPAKAVREKSLLAAIFGNEDEQQVRNCSAYFSAEYCDYFVTAVTRENIRDYPKYTEPRLVDRIIISLERHTALAVGDIVEIAGCPIAVVDIVDDDLMPTDEKQRAVDAIAPSVGGSFTDRSVQRLMVRQQLSSVRDTLEARSVGPYSLITLMPLKRHGVCGQKVTTTEISWLLENRFPAIAAELTALKCNDTFNRQKLQDLDEGRLTFPLTTELGASESLFAATENLRILGLAVDCETHGNCNAWRIAPATKDWLLKVAPLAIKKPDTINYRTYRPEKGGLFCEQTFGAETHARRQRSARIELSAPIVPIFFRLGEQPILSQVLGLDSEVIESIVGWRSGVDKHLQVLPIDDPNCAAKGADAIQKLVAECGKDLPFDLNCIIQNDVYVIPPDFRPLVLLESGNFATSDLNDLYRRVINRSNRLRKLRDLNAPQVIIENEIRELQLCVDQLQANGWKSSPVLGSSNRPLRSGLDLVLGELSGEDWKRVDWSASARAIIDNRIANAKCTLPQTIFDCLRCKSDEPILLGSGNSFVARFPIRGEDLTIRMHSSTSTMLNLSSGENCVVHRPITTQALAEATRMSTMSEAGMATNIPALDSNANLETLISRVLSGQLLMLDTPQLFLLGGAGNLLRRPDEESPMPEDDIRVAKKTIVLPPSLAELREVAESLERVSCIFRLTTSEVEPLPHQGRIGGRPWLPASVQWPKTRDGKPVPFFAQLPISPTCNDSLPFAVTTEMLLTLFWSEEWWEAEETSAPYVLLHDTSELQLRELPEQLQARPLFRIETELRKHFPGWDEIHQVLRYHFEKVPEDLLDALKKEMDIDSRQVLEESRIGGHGYWIQNPVEDFVAQIVSDEQNEFDFGDSGSLYIFGRSPDELTAEVQSH